MSSTQSTMQVNITGDNMALTDPLQDHVHVQLSKIEKKFPKISNVHVILRLDKKFQHTAEATMHLAGGKSGKIFADSTSKDMYTSINALFHKLEKQVLEHKQRMQDHDRDEHH